VHKRVKVKAYAVILVGGKGKRLKSISAASCPKAFLPITRTDETMFRKTLDRARKFIPASRIIVVANKHHADLVKKDFPDIVGENLVLEPLSRNTAPAIALAASLIEKRFTDAIMLVLPSDHHITGESKYAECLEKGIDFIKRHWREDPLIVIGIPPRFPATGFGYIKLQPKGPDAISEDIYGVDGFIEKPALKIAKTFLKDGRYLWNSGIFIFRASSILKAVDEFAPAISMVLGRLGAVRIDALYKRLPNISIDYAVMEKARAIYCVKGSYGWQDIGNPVSLKEVLEKELEGSGRPSVSMNILEKLGRITARDKR